MAVRSPTWHLRLIRHTQAGAHIGTKGEAGTCEVSWPSFALNALWPRNKNSVGSFPKGLQPPGRDDLLQAKRADSWDSSQGGWTERAECRTANKWPRSNIAPMGGTLPDSQIKGTDSDRKASSVGSLSVQEAISLFSSQAVAEPLPLVFILLPPEGRSI